MIAQRPDRSSRTRNGARRGIGIAAVVLLLALPVAAQPAATPNIPAAASSTAAPAQTGNIPDAAVAPAPTPPASLLPQNLSLPAMFQHADIVVRAVMLGLMAASVLTWTVLLAKGLELIQARRSVARSLADIETQETFAALLLRTRGTRSPVATMTAATAREITLSRDLPNDGIKERIASRLHRIEIQLGRRVNRGTGYLATIGATAPFIGLFGTVWGIMNSFIGISRTHTTNLAVVAPGIAEALLATAAGLVAAIPAVVIYNAFARGISGYRASLADLAAAIERLASRDMDAQRPSLKLAAE